MLVLARKANQSIVIGEDIRVVVLGVNGDRVRLGIEAPPEITIVREEIVESSDDDVALEDQHPDDPGERG